MKRSETMMIIVGVIVLLATIATRSMFPLLAFFILLIIANIPSIIKEIKELGKKKEE